MPLDHFAAPGRLADLSPAMAQGWSALVDFWIERELDALRDGDPNRPIRFFNELRTPVPDTAATAAIPWDGFPKVLRLTQPANQLWQSAEGLRSVAARFGGKLFARYPTGPVEVDFGYRNQDEYLEWFATPGEQPGQIEKLSFTCEPPEYWQFVAGGTKALVDAADLGRIAHVVPGDHNLLLRLYRTLVDERVTLDDLLYPAEIVIVRGAGPSRRFAKKGDYNPYNKWNTTHGIAHLTHPANTLRAEINLAAGGTVLRSNTAEQPVVDPLQLICCSGYGSPNRSSDPTIGSRVNGLARQGLSVTLRDPIGLYLNTIDPSGFEGPSGEDVSDCWRVIRGQAAAGPGESGMILRAEFGVDPARGFRVDQILADGEPIRFGGQVANKIGMVLTGKAHDLGTPAPALRACVNHGCRSPANADVLQILGAGQACNILDDPSQPGQHWTEAFPGLTTDEGIGLAPPTEGVATARVRPIPAALAADHAPEKNFAPTKPTSTTAPAALQEPTQTFAIGLSRLS